MIKKLILLFIILFIALYIAFAFISWDIAWMIHVDMIVRGFFILALMLFYLTYPICFKN
nr:MAG TPA: hypothetical protein [Crassvirales sp.]